MDSLGPQLDSAIEAALRMLEGNMGASRWNKQTRQQRQNKCRSNQDKYHWILKKDGQRMLEGNTGRTNNKEKDDNKDIIRINAIRTLCWYDYCRSEHLRSLIQERIPWVLWTVKSCWRRDWRSGGDHWGQCFLILWTFSIQNITIQ